MTATPTLAPPAVDPDDEERPGPEWLSVREVADLRGTEKRATARLLRRRNVRWNGALLRQREPKAKVWVYRPLLAVDEPNFGDRVSIDTAAGLASIATDLRGRLDRFAASGAAIVALMGELRGAMAQSAEENRHATESFEKLSQTINDLLSNIAA